MRRDLALTARPERRSSPITRVARPPARPGQLARPVPRADIERIAGAGAGAYESDPYVDYGRYLTAQGGILIVYKGIDEAGRHTLWRLVAWTGFTGLEAWLALTRISVATDWIGYAACAAAALFNLVIVAKPVEIYRRIEVRPDCLIIDGVDVFWQRRMESLPSFRPEGPDNMTLCGIYGTRYVEYLKVRRFDECDRAPEVLASDLADAMRQLWSNRVE